MTTEAAAPAATETITQSTTVETTAQDQQLAEASTKVEWLKDADADTVQFVGLKGWKSPDDVLKSYRNLEKVKGGIDSGKYVELPAEDSPQELKDAFFQKLGRPEKPDGYDFSKVEDKGMAESLRQFAFENGLPKGVAEKQVEWFEQATSKVIAANNEAVAVKHKEEVEELQRVWGASYTEKEQVVNEAANKFGMKTDQLDALKKAMGPKGAMEFLYKLGSSTGEATFRGSGNEGSGKLTPEQAKLALLKEGPELMKQEMDVLNPMRTTAMQRRIQLQRWSEGRA